MKIDQTHHARLLLQLHELAKDMGLGAVSARYFEELEKLVDQTINEISEIWEVEGEI